MTEANKLEIPVIGTGDTNVDPDELDFIIPANDDAIRAIRLLCALVADAAIEGARERSARAATEPEAVEAVAMPETEDEESGASDELVAALAGGAALTLRARRGRGRGPAPRRPCGPRRGGRGRGAPRRRRPRTSRPSSPARRPRRPRTTTRPRPPADPSGPDLDPARSTDPTRGVRRTPNTGATDTAWRTSRPSWSRNCASGPGPGSWIARRPSTNPTGTSRRRPSCCASAAWPRRPRRPAGTPARA